MKDAAVFDGEDNQTKWEKPISFKSNILLLAFVCRHFVCELKSLPDFSYGIPSPQV